jgi:hypothetical protein
VGIKPATLKSVFVVIFVISSCFDFTLMRFEDGTEESEKREKNQRGNSGGEETSRTEVKFQEPQRLFSKILLKRSMVGDELELILMS